MKKILTYGTFDLTHIGHIRILQRAKQLGDYLVVGVSSDEFNTSKGKKSQFSFDERKEIIASIKYVDEVISENGWNQKIEDIKKYDIDIFVMGDDWKGKFDDLKQFCEVIYIPRTPNISTTTIKKNIAGKN